MGEKERAISRPSARLLALVPVVGLAWVVLAVRLLGAGGALGVGVAAVSAGILAVGAALATWLARPSREGRLPVVAEDDRLWLPVATPLRAGLVALTGLVVLLGVAVVVGLLLDGPDALLSMARESAPRGQAFPFVLAGGAVLGAVLCLPLLVGLVRGTRGPRRVGLGPDGVRREPGRRAPAELVRWAEVGEVVVARRPSRVEIGRRGSAPGEGPRPLVVLARLHDADPVALAALVERYRDDPSARAAPAEPGRAEC